MPEADWGIWAGESGSASRGRAEAWEYARRACDQYAWMRTPSARLPPPRRSGGCGFRKVTARTQNRSNGRDAPIAEVTRVRHLQRQNGAGSRKRHTTFSVMRETLLS